MRVIGLCGAHRTGKSTLAKALAVSYYNYIYLAVGISAMQAQYGWDSSKQDYSWEERRKIQMHLLESFDNLLSRPYLQPAVVTRDIKTFVYDRTPIDLIGYAMWSFPKEPTDFDNEWMKNYIDSCVRVTNKHFDHVFLVQPGIPLVESPTSAAADEEMIETFNQCYLAQFLNKDLVIPSTILDRALLDLDERTQFIREITSW